MLDWRLLKPVPALQAGSPVAAEPTADRNRFEQALFARAADWSPGTPDSDAFGMSRIESSGVHSLAASSYPEKAIQAQSRRIAGLEFVHWLWTVGGILALCVLLGYVFLVMLADLPGVRAVALGSATFVLVLTAAMWLGSRENKSERIAMRWEAGTGEAQMEFKAQASEVDAP